MKTAIEEVAALERGGEVHGADGEPIPIGNEFACGEGFSFGADTRQLPDDGQIGAPVLESGTLTV